MTAEFPLMITVEFKGVSLSHANKVGTSKFDWMCFEHIKLIGMNFSFAKLWGKLKINKMSEDLRNFENFIEEKKISSVLNPVPLTTYALSFYRSQIFFWLVQIFCSRPKNNLHIVAVTNSLCQTKR